jgi:2-polyprenyl-3-methyl-5-hydroxy-6-metoxy-1,4-benzoquinol methylase
MSKGLIDYYTERFDESGRHHGAFGMIQAVRTMELISRYLPGEAASILDVGGAAGVYSFQLADLGHQVTLLDVVPAHIKKAREENENRSNPLVELIACDIREYKSERSFDAIILHGPLYHMTERADRIAVLQKSADLLGANGIVLAFGINRFAGYFYGVRSGAIMEPEYRQIVLEEMQSGVRLREPGWYFHKPEELQAECEEAGLRVVAKKSVVTQAWMLPDADERIQDSQYVQQIVSLARDSEDYLGIGQDMMYVGKRK